MPSLDMDPTKASTTTSENGNKTKDTAVRLLSNLKRRLSLTGKKSASLDDDDESRQFGVDRSSGTA